MGALVFVFLNLFIYIKSFAAESLLKYPPTLECSFDKMFNKTDEGKAEYQKYAMYDKAHTIRGHGTGYYQCYC